MKFKKGDKVRIYDSVGVFEMILTHDVDSTDNKIPCTIISSPRGDHTVHVYAQQMELIEKAKVTKKLYQYAYLMGSEWRLTGSLYENNGEFLKKYDYIYKDMKSFKHLPHTMVEVESVD